jgi:plastocyanin
MKRLTAILCGTFLLAGCGGGGESGSQAEEQAAGGAAPEQAAAPAGGGTIAGMVHFSGTAPANPAIDMAEEAACAAKHTMAPTDPQVMVANGMLANAFVYVKSGLPAGASYPTPTTPVVIDQDGCLYTPRVLGVMAGQPIEIRNSDPVSHNIKAVPTTNRGFNISQPRQGMTTTRRFDTPELMVPLECNVHGWMKGFVGVMSHPFFAVSGADGGFTISGLPAGTYELEAWHETLGTRTVTVTVTEGGAVSTTITFGPSA